jgi:hypothetical protein
MWHTKKVDKAWCTLTILFLLPTTVASHPYSGRKCVCERVCVFKRMITSCSSLPPRTFIWLFHKGRIFYSQRKWMLCESNEGSITFSYATYIDICHYLCYQCLRWCLSDGAVAQHVVSFCALCLWYGFEQAGLLLFFFFCVLCYARTYCVRKLLQFLVSQYNLYGLFATPKISQSQFETSTVFLYC